MMCGECNWPIYFDPNEPISENIVEGAIPRRFIKNQKIIDILNDTYWMPPHEPPKDGGLIHYKPEEFIYD